MLPELAVAVGIALVDSLNPATIGQASVLATGERPQGSVLAFWAGGFSFYIALASVLVFGPGQLISGLVSNPPPALRIAQLVLGVGAIVGGIILWRRRHTLHIGRRLVRGGPRTAFRLGLLVTLADVPNAFPFYGLVAYLAGSGLSHGRQVSVLFVYTFVYLAPVLLVLLVRTLAKERADRILSKARDLVERYTATVAAVVLVVAGTALTVHGIVRIVAG